MKNLTLIVPGERQQAFADALRALSEVEGFSFTHMEGHGAQSERDPGRSLRDLVVGYTPQVRLDLVLSEDAITGVLTALRGLCPQGTGVYWITPVEKFGHL